MTITPLAQNRLLTTLAHCFVSRCFSFSQRLLPSSRAVWIAEIVPALMILIGIWWLSLN